MKILLHSSKTMKPESTSAHALTTPRYIAQAAALHDSLRHMSLEELAHLMNITLPLAEKVRHQLETWSDAGGTAAALTFRGDIYSGLSAGQWNTPEAVFAQEHLFILSGLYGLLRPFDAIMPYRLEMGYKLKTNGGLNVNKFWEQQTENLFAQDDTYINLTAKEYFNAVAKHLRHASVISPKFLTISPKTQQPTFVTVHAKIARGAFANWLITNHIDDPQHIPAFNLLDYHYDTQLSTAPQPVFVCQEFGGLGLSVRLK